MPFRTYVAAVVLLLAVTRVTASRPEPSSRGSWTFEAFKLAFDKTYPDSSEEAKRASIFQGNQDRIERENARQNTTYSLGLNQFSDLTLDEFRALRKPLPPLSAKDGAQAPFLGLHEWEGQPGELPASVDWRAAGKVTAIKNQGQCGACWAFSATGAIESAVAIAGGNLTSLSEQQMVDCHSLLQVPPLLPGCSGGLPEGAFKFAHTHGLCTEASYNYTAKWGKCKQAACQVAVPKGQVQGYRGLAPVPRIIPASEAKLMSAVAQQPVSVAIQADSDAFMHYKTGVLSGDCGEWAPIGMVDHAVLLVGYGTDAKLGDYWLVKNSWGTTWGMEGYVMLARGKNAGSKWGACHVLAEPSYPVVSKMSYSNQNTIAIV